MNFSEDAKQATEVLCEGINSVCLIYDADFGDFHELYEAGAGEELAKSVDFQLCDPPYNERRKSELENTGLDMFEPNDIEDFCDLAIKLIKPAGHGHLFCFLL